MPALLLISTGCGVLSPSADEAAIPPPPPVVEGVPDPIPPAPADGLHRFVVRPPVQVLAEGGTVADGATDPGASTTTTTAPDTPPVFDPVWTVDQALVDQIDEDTIVVFRDGIPGFVDDQGQFVALVGNSSASTGAPTGFATGLTEDEVIAQLTDLDGVVSAVAVGDGTFAVVAEAADTLAGIGYETFVDTPVALAADPYEPYQWTLDNNGQNLNSLDNPPTQTPDADIDGLEAKAGARGAGVVVAVIDTGVDFGHPDLAARRWTNPGETCGNGVDDDGNGFVDDCHGWDFGYEDNTPFNPGTLEHGTHVAGTIAATADNGVGVVGMAPEADIMDLNVQGPGGMTISGIARAVRYAADNGADIVNMSLGTQPGTSPYAVQPLIDAVRYAETKGTLVVVAAGNSSVNLDQAAVYPANIEGPNMITVGASAPDETKASFSNYGSPVDLFAPGVLIVSTVPGNGYKFMNGTSMASPTAAGAAAAVLSANPSLDPAGIREQLVGTGDTFAAYENKAANPVRINQAWALGIDGDPAQAQVTIEGLASATTAGVVADITMSDPGGQYQQPYHWEGSLVALANGQVYGLVDHPVSVDWQPDTTNERGAVTLTSGGTRARLETQLPPGTYGLVVEAVPDTDPTVRLGEAFVSTFVVPEDAPTTSTTAPTTPTTAPVTSTTAPSGGGGTTTTTGPPTTGPTTSPPTSTPTSTAPAPSTTATTWWSTSTSWWTTSTTSTTWAPNPTTTPTTAPTTSTTARATTTTARATTTTARVTSTTARATTTTAPATTTTARATTTTARATTTTARATTTTARLTTTTAPTTTASTSPPTTTVSGDFAVYQITPSEGNVGEQTMVSITGRFPSQVYVWFGDQAGQLVVHSSTWIVVVAPPSYQAGAVDVTLRNANSGIVLAVPNGFTYRSTGGGGGGTTTTTAPTTSTTSPGGGGGGGGATTSTTSSGGGGGGGGTTSTTSGGGGGVTSTTSGGGGGTTSTTSSGGGGGGSTSTTSGGGGTTSTTSGGGGTTSTSTVSSSTSTTALATTTTRPSGPQRQSRAAVTGGSLTLGGGLTGVPLQGLGGIAEVPHCISDPCRTRRIP